MAKGIITCFSAGNSEYKDITIPTATEVCPDRLFIRFQNANEYGETTADTPTHPKLRVYNTDNTLLKTAEICDSTGHYAGKGCYDDDFIMEFMLIDDNDETLALIKNSDVREKTASYVIKSDGRIRQSTTMHVNGSTDTTWTFPVPFPNANYKVTYGCVEGVITLKTREKTTTSVKFQSGIHSVAYFAADFDIIAEN